MEFDQVYKIIIVGDAETGKSQLLSRFCNNTFSEEYNPTVIMEHTRKKLQPKICAHFWDLAGNDVFKTITSCYYDNAVGAIVIYDITKLKSFESAEHWIDHIREKFGVNPPSILLLGNKLDLRHQRSVSTLEGRDLSLSKKTFFMETSAKDATNVEIAFQLLIDHILTERKTDVVKNDVNIDPGLEKGAGKLNEMTKNSRSDRITVVQSPPQAKQSVRQSARNCLESAKESCCYKFSCCW